MARAKQPASKKQATEQQQQKQQKQQENNDNNSGGGATRVMSDELKKVIEIQNKINDIISEEHVKMREIAVQYQQKRAPLQVERREALKTVPHFWALVLSSHDLVSHMMTEEDQDMLKYCVNVSSTVSFDEEKKTQTTRVEFEFDHEKNPFFSDKMLFKQVTIKSGKNKSGGGDNDNDDEHDEDMGDEELDIKQSGTIHWKGEMAKKKNKNSKKQQKDEKGNKKRSHEEMEESFFSIFETEGDMDADLCDMIHQDLTEDPVSFYLTALADDEVDGEGDDENDDDEE